MKNRYNVIIVGAGPAGLSCAEVLAKSGKSVLVLEKNNEVGPKICAGGLTTKVKKENFLSLRDIDRIFHSIKIIFPGTIKKITCHNPLIATIDRGKLGKIMLEKALKFGAEVETGIEVKEISNNSIIANGQKINYQYLVGADGSNSMIRKFLGIKTEKILVTLQYVIPQEIQKFEEMKYFLDSRIFNGYFWVFPHRNYTIVGAGYNPKYTRKKISLKNTFEKWLKDKNIKTARIKLEGWPINIDYRGYQFGNKFLIGDAGGFTSGLTGEGIYFAIISGKEVAGKIIDPQYNCPEISKILKIKRNHENFLKLLTFFNNLSPNLGFKLAMFSCDLPLTKKMIEKIIA